MDSVKDAISELKKGKLILIYDDEEREGETDFVIASQFVTKDTIRRMRVDGGGLVCCTIHESTYEKLGLPFMVDINARASVKYPILKKLDPYDIPYDAKSAFSITMNHRKTFTGVTDIDRALTVSEFAKFVSKIPNLTKKEAADQFGRLFRAPGHIHMLNAAKGLLNKRLGHTELTTALMLMANLTPSATICEMMADDGYAKPPKETKKYADRNGMVILKGKEVIAEWKRRNMR